MRVITQSGGRVVVSFSPEEWEIARDAVESQRAIDAEEAEVSEACRVDIEYARGDSDYLARVEEVAAEAVRRVRVAEENERDRERERAWYTDENESENE